MALVAHIFIDHAKSDESWDHVFVSFVIMLSHPAAAHAPTSHPADNRILCTLLFSVIRAKTLESNLDNVSLSVNDQLLFIIIYTRLI